MRLFKCVAIIACAYGVQAAALDFVIPDRHAPAKPAAAAPPAAPEPVTAILNDGIKVEFEADGTVWAFDDKGNKFQPPDGTMTLRDGTPFTVKEGKRVEE